MSIKIIACRDTYLLRRKVLWPGKTFAEIALSEDQDGIHLGKFTDDNKLVGVISLFINQDVMQFKKFAIDELYQAKGFGSQLLSETKEIATRFRCRRIICDARSTTTQFYTKNGFKSDYIFLKYEKPYVRMFYELES